MLHFLVVGSIFGGDGVEGGLEERRDGSETVGLALGLGEGEKRRKALA